MTELSKWFALTALFAIVALAEEPAPRLAIPDAPALDAATVIVDEVYGAERAAATTPEARALLAKRLAEVGVVTLDDPAGAWVLWAQARELATLAGDPETTLLVVDHLASRFEVDALALKIDSLAAIAQPDLPPAKLGLVLTACSEIRREAIRQERFDDAARAVEVAAARAADLKDAALIQRIAALAAEVEEARAGFEATAPSLAALAESPEDADANDAVGRYRCFLQGDWERGLPLLRKSPDEAVRSAAENDLGPAQEPALAVAAADAWWQIAETQTGLAQRNLRERAAMLYAPHLESLAGLTRARALTRTADTTNVDEFRVVIPTPPPSREVRLLDLKPSTAWTSYGHVTAGEREVHLTSGLTTDTIFAHADSRVIYSVPDGATRFRAVATTLDRRDDRATHFRFIVMTNKKKVLLESRELTTYPQHQIEIDVELPPDTEKLVLITRNMWDHGMQWSVWAKPRFVLGGATATTR